MTERRPGAQSPLEVTFQGPHDDEIYLSLPEDYPDGRFVQIGAGDNLDWGVARLSIDQVRRLRDLLTTVLRQEPA